MHTTDCRKLILAYKAFRIGLCFIVLLYMTCFIHYMQVYAYDERDVFFSGDGTEDNPYSISCLDDFLRFRDLVNSGESFNYKYFRQDVDLDLASENNWEPIGLYGSGNYFCGYYNGNGHVIKNIVIHNPGENVGLFGVLKGEVANLGIESGKIEGYCTGSIASHGAITAVIYNCYNKASVYGDIRAGGIADAFVGNIINCINLGEVNSVTEEPKGILSYDCRRIEGSYCLDIEPVSYRFNGEIVRSGTIEAEDITNRFFTDFYDNSSIDDRKQTVYMMAENGDIRFSNRNNYHKKNNEGLLLIVVVSVFVVLLVLLIGLDCYFNIYGKNKNGKS